MNKKTEHITLSSVCCTFYMSRFISGRRSAVYLFDYHHTYIINKGYFSKHSLCFIISYT